MGESADEPTVSGGGTSGKAAEIDPAHHSRAHRRILWLLAVASIGLGAYLTRIDFLGEEWVSRAGCVIVALGIWSGLGGLMQERIMLKGLELRRRMSVVRTRRRLRGRGVEQAVIDAHVAEIEKSFKERAEALEKELKLSVGLLEVSLLITGTLVWGFGDLVTRLW